METEKISYLIGRLVGLNELISLLKEIVQKSEKAMSSDIVKTMILRISAEMDQIIDELQVEKGIHEGKITISEKPAKEKKVEHEEKHAKVEKKEKKKEKSSADELMQELISMKGK